MGEAEQAVTAGAAVLDYLGAQAAVVADRLPGALRRDPDALHDLRVALRRMRSTLQACRSVLAGEQTDALVGELRWLGRQLGPLRDLQVQEERLVQALEASDAGASSAGGALGEWFAAAEAEAAATALAALKGARGRAVLDAVDALLAQPPLTASASAPAQEVLPSVIAAAARRARKRWRRARQLPAGAEHDHALHELRKAVKRLRYAAELGAAALGERADRLADAAAALQQTLGDHQDAVVARALLDEVSEDPSLDGVDGFAIGWLAHAQRRDAEALEALVADAWHAVRKAAKAVEG